MAIFTILSQLFPPTNARTTCAFYTKKAILVEFGTATYFGHTYLETFFILIQNLRLAATSKIKIFMKSVLTIAIKFCSSESRDSISPKLSELSIKKTTKSHGV